MPFKPPIQSFAKSRFCHLRYALKCVRRRTFTDLSLATKSFVESVSKPSSRYQIYISRSRNVYVNLSIEHYLLQKTPTDSVVLFLYLNGPCVVIGRNQNPWLEANLKLLRDTDTLLKSGDHPAGEKTISDSIELVRRRSGGGAVFHDLGNVNYSVICPTADFSRNKHAEMVVRAVRRVNPRARVNERYDIVLDQGEHLPVGARPNPDDTHETAYRQSSEKTPPLKVSGSAYKLTRNRSLHHGTCLVHSANVNRISQFLRSPARPFIKARGVDSVRSPVSNIHELCRDADVTRFQELVVEAFVGLYGLSEDCVHLFRGVGGDAGLWEEGNTICGFLSDTDAEIPEIAMGVKELQSPEWTYGQTPQFTMSTFPTEEDDRARPSLPFDIPTSARLFLRSRSGIIDSFQASLSSDEHVAADEMEKTNRVLKGLKLNEIENFYGVLKNCFSLTGRQGTAGLSSWLNHIFGKT